VRRLRRGQDLSQAEPVFEVPAEHLMAVVRHDPTPGFERNVAVDVLDFYNSTVQVQEPGGRWRTVDAPTDVQVEVHRNWLVFAPLTDWEVDGTVHPAGALLVADLEAYLAGDRALIPVFRPDAHTSLSSTSWTRSYLLLTVLRDVVSEILIADPADGFRTRRLDAGAPLAMFDVAAVDDDDEETGDDFWLTSTGFLTPTTLHRGTLGAPAPGGGPAAAVVKASPSYFDESGYRVEQHFAVSADGTRVPYFQVSPRNLVLDGGNPTLMNGYGGFLQSLTPSYSGVFGRSWLARRTGDGRGGVYVLANIRGGGEYGPRWHQAALQQNRYKAFEDFAAVAEDLAARGVTRRNRLAATGRSNGGLLMGNMLTRYPHLFGAISCGVPLLDMRRYTRLAAGASWIAEYGNPDVPEQWAYLEAFSPYHQVRPETDYPAALIWTATSDDRVGPEQARKMAARMQDLGIPHVWFHEALDGGHAGASDNRQSAQMYARSHEFLWRAVTEEAFCS
jgi:prolyl oligopeptidase